MVLLCGVPYKYLRGGLGEGACCGGSVWYRKLILRELGLILEVQVLAGAERGLAGRLNGFQWKKLLVGLADQQRGSPCRTGGHFYSCRGQGQLSWFRFHHGPDSGFVRILTDPGSIMVLDQSESVLHVIQYQSRPILPLPDPGCIMVLIQDLRPISVHDGPH